MMVILESALWWTEIGIMDSLGNINTVFRNSYPENIDVAQLNLNVISDSGFVVTGFMDILLQIIIVKLFYTMQ